MTHLGDIVVGEDISFKFTTVTTTGAPTQLAGSPVISVYRNGSLVQDTSGITLTVDFDGVTGLNHVNITTNGNPSFYYDRASYAAVITTGTVGGTSVVGYVVAQWKMRQSIAEQVWGQSVGALGTVSDSFASAVAEMWNRVSSLLDAPISTRLASSSYTAPDNAAIGSIAGRLPVDLIGGRLDAHVGSVANGVLSFAKFTQSFWDGISAYVWSASVGQFGSVSDSFAGAIAEMWSRLSALLDVAVSTRQSQTSADQDTVRIQDLQARVPAGLINGRMDSHVGSIGDGVITYPKFAESYWQALADRIWGASVGAYGTISDSFASAIAELWSRPASGGSSLTASEVWASPSRTLTANANLNDLDAAGVRAAIGLGSANLDTQLGTLATGANLALGLSGIANIMTRLPADLINGRMDSHVGSIATGVISFSKFSQNYWDGITAYVWTASVGATSAVSDSFASAIAEMWSKSHRAEEVWDVTLSAHLAAGSAGFALNAAGSAGDPWGTALPGAYGAGTAGKIIGDNINATISSRASEANQTVVGNMVAALVAGVHVSSVANGILTFAKFSQNFWDGVTSYVWGASVGAYGTISDSFASAVSEMWSRLSALLDVAVSTRLASSGYTAPDNSTILAVQADVAAIKLKTDNLPSDPADQSLVIAATNALAAQINALNNLSADQVWDEDVDGGVTARQSLRLTNSVLGGKASGLGGTNVKFRDLADTKDRVDATVDASGNRTAVTRDLT